MDKNKQNRKTQLIFVVNKKPENGQWAYSKYSYLCDRHFKWLNLLFDRNSSITSKEEKKHYILQKDQRNEHKLINYCISKAHVQTEMQTIRTCRIRTLTHSLTHGEKEQKRHCLTIHAQSISICRGNIEFMVLLSDH